MTKLVILSAAERKRFDFPPTFNADEQTIYFALNNDILSMLGALRTATNKAGLLLQLGYFRSHGKFYTANQFRQQDINYIAKLLDLDVDKLDFSKYQKRIPSEHRNKILAYFHWMPLNQNELQRLSNHLLWHVKNQSYPKQLFFTAIDYCWQNKLELSSYNQIALLITNIYN